MSYDDPARSVHGIPFSPGELGDTVFDGTTTWVCFGGMDWRDRIETERPPSPVGYVLPPKLQLEEFSAAARIPMPPAARMGTTRIQPWAKWSGIWLLTVTAVLMALWLWSVIR